MLPPPGGWGAAPSRHRDPRGEQDEPPIARKRRIGHDADDDDDRSLGSPNDDTVFVVET